MDEEQLKEKKNVDKCKEQENENEAQFEDAKSIEGEEYEDGRDEDCCPRLATQLSLHEELKMSSSFANHSDNEEGPDVAVENVGERYEGKEEKTEGDAADDDGDEAQEEEEGDPMSLFLPHKPFCGRLTSSALSKAEEYSETETYSSGFSEDYKITKPVHRQTQTCDRELGDISNPVNDLDNHFQTTPRYKVIFKEIFQVLKQANKMEVANKVEVAKRKDTRPRQIIWPAGNYSDLGKTPDYPAESWLKQSDSLKPKTTFPDYSSLPPTSISSIASMARLKQIQESYASVLRKGIQDA